MTTQTERGQEKKFVCAILPWLVAGSALVIYLLTFNHWVSFGNMAAVARAAGQTWAPEVSAPLFYLVTYPFGWLPASWIPVALNLFTVVCAVLVLALLARSVALLPHDRTHEQRLRLRDKHSQLTGPGAWIPPVLAVVVCGLQLTFWENATSASKSMFDVLLFAYVVRCLLEHRIDHRDSWVFQAAFVYGASMTNNWLMLALFPLFIASLIWIRGFSFFDLRFLRGMFLCGLAGVLFYLVLPFVYTISHSSFAGFWPALKANLLGQKFFLAYLARLPKHVLLLMVLTSLLPILLISIRWASYYGDPSKLGIAITTGILHLAHAGLLVACVWAVFDPVFSLRNKVLVPLPSLYYLGALSVGYFVGYFMIVFKPLPDRMQRVSTGQVVLHRISQAGIWTLLVLVPVGLAYKNLPLIRMTNGPAVREYASQLTKGLPNHCVVLSDDLRKLYLAEDWMARQGRTTNYIFVATASLTNPQYHGWMQRRYPDDWPLGIDPKLSRKLPDRVALETVGRLSRKHPLYYLHPSFGYYFEHFYPQPHGLALQLKLYSTNSLDRPELTKTEIAENEKFWQQTQEEQARLLPFIRPAEPAQKKEFRDKLLAALQVPRTSDVTAAKLGEYYAQGLDLWGVLLQREGKVKAAGRYLAEAVALNPRSVSAKANLELNRKLQAGQAATIRADLNLEEAFGAYRTWEDVLRDDGPFDDPTFCYPLGRTFQRGHLYRQSFHMYERVHQLVPDFLPASFSLAQLNVLYGRPHRALQLLAEIRSRPDALEDSGIKQLDLKLTEAAAYFKAGDKQKGGQILKDLIAENSNNTNALAAVAQMSTTPLAKQFEIALAAVQRQLQLMPDNVDALINLGYVHMQMGDYEKAIPWLTQALTLKTNNSTALLDRAIAYLSCDKLPEAQKDYEALEKIFPRAFQVYYGLGEIAWRNKDTNAAIHYYELYMTNCFPNSPEAKSISERLKSLKAGAP